jgi:hypothetical protein
MKVVIFAMFLFNAVGLRAQSTWQYFAMSSTRDSVFIRHKEVMPDGYIRAWLKLVPPDTVVVPQNMMDSTPVAKSYLMEYDCRKRRSNMVAQNFLYLSQRVERRNFEKKDWQSDAPGSLSSNVMDSLCREFQNPFPKH